MWRSKSCGHTPRSAPVKARPTCGTGPVACRRGAMSCSGESCCTIRQHRSGGGLLSPRGSRGSKFWVSIGSCGLRDDAIGGRCQETPSVVASDSQRQGCAVSLIAVASLRRGSSQLLFVIRPDLVVQFARSQDASLWQCMCRILGILVTLCDEMAKATATLPFALGGMGLRSAERSPVAAH